LISKLSSAEGSDVFGCWWGEEIGGELGSLSEVTLDLHLTSHEGVLSGKLSVADSVEIGVSHGESSIGLLVSTLLNKTISVFEV